VLAGWPSHVGHVSNFKHFFVVDFDFIELVSELPIDLVNGLTVLPFLRVKVDLMGLRGRVASLRNVSVGGEDLGKGVAHL